MKLINEYENSIREIIFLFDRFNRLFQFDLQQSSSEQRFAVIISSKKMLSIFNLKQFFVSSSLSIDLKQFFLLNLSESLSQMSRLKHHLTRRLLFWYHEKQIQFRSLLFRQKKISIVKSRQNVAISIRKLYIDAHFDQSNDKFDVDEIVTYQSKSIFDISFISLIRRFDRRN